MKKLNTKEPGFTTKDETSETIDQNYSIFDAHGFLQL